MKNVYFPLAGMNYIINDVAQIVENKVSGKNEIHLWLSAQVNCYPHIGTLTNFMSAFSLAKHLENYYDKPVKIIVELLESVTGEKQTINGVEYYKNLENVADDNGETIKEKYLPFFIDILDRLKKLNNIEYRILFFYEYQTDPLVKKSLLKVMNNYDLLKYTLDPQNGEIRLRFPCPKCGLTEKHLVNTKIDGISDNSLTMSSLCPLHGAFYSSINDSSTEKFDMNVPLRYLVKILYLLQIDKENNVMRIH